MPPGLGLKEQVVSLTELVTLGRECMGGSYGSVWVRFQTPKKKCQRGRLELERMEKSGWEMYVGAKWR